MEGVVGAPDRLRRVAAGIAEHFTEQSETLVGKAMVVAYSRRIAAELTGLLRERLGEEVVDCIISAQATDDPELRVPDGTSRSCAKWPAASVTLMTRCASSS